MNRTAATTRAASVSVALMGLAVALPLGLIGEPAIAARTCEALTAREHRVHRIGHSLTDAARQFCGHQSMPAALPGHRMVIELSSDSIIAQPWPALAVRIPITVLPALTDLPPPVDL